MITRVLASPMLATNGVNERCLTVPSSNRGRPSADQTEMRRKLDVGNKLLGRLLDIPKELIGAKMLAPYFGSSLYVWATVMAVTLGGLALGYFTGGFFAEKNRNNRGKT